MRSKVVLLRIYEDLQVSALFTDGSLSIKEYEAIEKWSSLRIADKHAMEPKKE